MCVYSTDTQKCSGAVGILVCFVVLALSATSASSLAAVSEHVSWADISYSWIYDNPDNPASRKYEFWFEIDTDDTVNFVEFQTPQGSTFQIPKLPEQHSGVVRTSYEEDEWGCYWEYGVESANINDLLPYGDGLYTITVHYEGSGQDQTTVWFGIPETSSPLPQPSQRPILTSPAHNSVVNNDLVTFVWGQCTDPAADGIWIMLEYQDLMISFEGEGFATDETSWDSVFLPDGLWKADIAFECYDWATNSDGISYAVWKSSKSLYDFTVTTNTSPGAYEVWGGDSWPSELCPDFCWETPCDQAQALVDYGYEKLGESDGQTATFAGGYEYYMIAARGQFLLYSIRGSDGSYYSSFESNWEITNVQDKDNLLGAPVCDYATVGLLPSTSRFSGYVLITNPANWTSLTVIMTDEPPITIYVDGVSGNDSTGTGALASPYKTVRKALQVADNGDRIIIRAGTYPENITVNKRLTIEAQGGLVRIGQ